MTICIRPDLWKIGGILCGKIMKRDQVYGPREETIEINRLADIGVCVTCSLAGFISERYQWELVTATVAVVLAILFAGHTEFDQTYVISGIAIGTMLVAGISITIFCIARSVFATAFILNLVAGDNGIFLQTLGRHFTSIIVTVAR
jgi:hypothetical protein